MTYYYIATESETDRYFYDANKWSETQGGTTPTSGTPSTSDDFVIGESSTVYVGTAESFITFSFRNSESVNKGLPNSAVIYGYVRFSNTPIIRACNLSINYGELKSDMRVYLSQNTQITVGDGCGFDVTAGSLIVDSDDDFDCIQAAATATLAINLRLIANGTTYHLPDWDITTLIAVYDQEAQTLNIVPNADHFVGSLSIMYTNNTVTTGALNITSPLQVTTSVFNYSSSTSPFVLTGNAKFKLIGTNTQYVQFAAITSAAGVINIDLAKPSGNVNLFGITANLSGYCGTDAAGNLIPGQSPTSAKVTVGSTSDITFAGETHLAYLTINGTVTANAQTVLYNHVLSGVLNIPTGQAVRCYKSTRNAESQLTGLGNYVLTWGVSETSALGTVTGVSIIDDVETVPIVGAITRVNDDDEQTISWLAASNDYGTAVNYDIAVTTCNAAGTETTAAIYDQAVLEYVNSSLTTGSTYGYAVRVVSRGSVGRWTSAVLQTPTLTATAIVAGRIDAVVTPVALARSYVIEYATTADFASYQTTTLDHFGTCEINGLLSGATYYLRAKVFGDYQTSDYTASVTVAAAVDYYRVTRGQITINTDDTIDQGQTIACAARIINLGNDQPLNRLAVASVKYSVYKIIEQYGNTNQEAVEDQQNIAADIDATISAAIDLDSPFWTVDQGGCNFVLIPDIRTSPAFEESGRYAIVATIALTVGNPIVIRFEVEVND